MSAKLPVIASDFEAWRPFVEDHRCGLLVDPLDPGAIAGAMQWMLDHPEEARAMGVRGRAAVEEHYNWGQESKHLLDMYAAITSGRQAVP
jgi:glycosyltransferase involved in cell wall biosynthesis